MKPCAENCHTDTTAFAILSFSVKKSILYPKLVFKTPVVLKNTSTSILLQQNISSPGYIYSIAKLVSEPLLSVSDIIRNGVSALCQVSLSGKLEITNLQPESDYLIYFYTEDFLGHSMNLTEILATAISFKTPCCRQLTFQSNFLSISDSNMTVDLFSLSLNSPPTLPCLFEIIPSVDGVVHISPSNYIQFSRTSLTQSFRVVGLIPGLLNITTSTLNCSNTIVAASFMLEIRSFSSPPPVTISRAKFSDTGIILLEKYFLDANF
jgi:hypothetical protein